MPEFIPGLQLAEAFCHEAVQPILAAEYPGMPYSAALIGPGSEVLGFDTPMSVDHDWGPRLMIFLTEADHAAHSSDLHEVLRHHLPREFRGYPVGFLPPTPDDPGTYMLDHNKAGPVNHRIMLWTVRNYVLDYLGVDIDGPVSAADWLTMPMQKLRTFTSGAVFHDDLGLQLVRDRFAWFPHGIWLYMMAGGWQRIGQEEHLMGRAGYAGDEIGSALIASRLVRDIMRLCFLQARQYAPYAKWFGTAFKQLDCAAELALHLQGVLTAATWQEREQHLIPAYEALARQHNALNLTEPIREQVVDFHNRPFKVLGVDVSGLLVAQITDPAVYQIATKPLIGNIDLLSDNTDLVGYGVWQDGLRRLYQD